VNWRGGQTRIGRRVKPPVLGPDPMRVSGSRVSLHGVTLREGRWSRSEWGRDGGQDDTEISRGRGVQRVAGRVELRCFIYRRLGSRTSEHVLDSPIFGTRFGTELPTKNLSLRAFFYRCTIREIPCVSGTEASWYGISVSGIT